ncbi:uncharacterized protein with LGFP repeats [Arthrobacter sp. MP_2.3]
MNLKRMMATYLAAALISAASLTGLSAAPASATSQPPASGPATAPAASTTPSPLPSPTTSASVAPAPVVPATKPQATAPAPMVEKATQAPPAAEPTGGAPTSVHTFQTPPLPGIKGAAPRALSTEAYSLARSGDIKVRLVTVQLANVKTNISMDSAVAAVEGTSAYWKRMSSNRLSMSVASKETFTSKATSWQRYPDMMNTIANELGWVPSPYTALVVFVSSPTLSDGAYGAGWSYNGTSGRVIMPLPASLTRSVLTHEFGHVLGLMHANSLECGSGAQDVSSNADGSFADPTCSIREYGDSMDLMGVSQTTQPTISSSLWDFGGFGTGREIRNLGQVSNVGSYTLTAWAGTADNRAVKFTDPVSGEVYYLELRLPVGFDAGTAVNGNRGVKIVQQFGSGSLVLMPDSHRFAGYYSARHAWQAGQTFTTHAGTRVIINWISDSAAGVTIESTSGVGGKAIAELASATTQLGAATSGVSCGLRNGGCFQLFGNGAVIWSAGTGAQASLYGPVRDAWARTGFENGPLGYPTSALICGIRDQGCFQAYENGEILYSAASGAQPSTAGAIRTAYRKAGAENSALGYPTSGEVCGLRNSGCYQSYQRGEILWSQATGAQLSEEGPVRTAYRKAGAENSALGFPTSGKICGLPQTGCYQGFQAGAILQTPATGAQLSPNGPIRTAWANSGFEGGPLGYPTGETTCGLVNDGCYQPYQKGAILWSPATGAQLSLNGPIRTAWAGTRYETGPLGYPTSAVTCGLVNGGCYQAYQHGEILYSTASGAKPTTTGAIRTLYRNNAAENGLLGYPTSAEVCSLVNSGCYQNYQKGAIIWSPATGAQLSPNGPIRNAWAATRYETGTLAYPTTGVVCGLVKSGCYQNYQGGAIIWSPTTGARISPNGPIRTLWQQTGFETGRLGYPTGAQTCNTTKTTCTQPFTGGKITWTTTRGAYIN